MCIAAGACGTTPSAQSPSAQAMLEQDLQQRSAGGQVFLVQVPAAGNAISNSMVVSMLAGGSSTGSVKNIQTVLGVSGGTVRVTGSSQSVNVATLRRALRDFQGQSNARVYIDASPAQIVELRKLADPKGIVINDGK